MNAPATFPAMIAAPSADLAELAAKVLSGEWTRPYGIGGIYTQIGWQKAAQRAVDGDWEDLADMMRDEESADQCPNDCDYGKLWNNADPDSCQWVPCEYCDEAA